MGLSTLFTYKMQEINSKVSNPELQIEIGEEIEETQILIYYAIGIYGLISIILGIFVVKSCDSSYYKIS